MKAIQTGNTFRIYDNSMKAYNNLPPAAYLVNFSKETGFYLSLYSEIKITEKVYGIHESKVNKVLHSFFCFNRNLGVILSGDKGIGKSLFTKMLAQRGIEQGLPLIIVNKYIPGIGEYLNSIEQEVIVLFDEFDKTFAFSRDEDYDPQAEMLTLFDGIAQGKKLFLVTCNDLSGLNNFLVNRPGRFHYHFRFEYPSAEDIKEYLMDSLNEEYYKEIPAVIAFSGKVNLNYDCLRAIAFELNCGLPFDEAITDLNIININAESYSLIVILDNGEILKSADKFDIFSSEKNYSFLKDPETADVILDISYIPSTNHYDANRGCCVIGAEDLNLRIRDWILEDKDSDENAKRYYQKYKDVKPIRLELRRKKEKNIHYLV